MTSDSRNGSATTAPSTARLSRSSKCANATGTISGSGSSRAASANAPIRSRCGEPAVGPVRPSGQMTKSSPERSTADAWSRKRAYRADRSSAGSGSASADGTIT